MTETSHVTAEGKRLLNRPCPACGRTFENERARAGEDRCRTCAPCAVTKPSRIPPWVNKDAPNPELAAATSGPSPLSPLEIAKLKQQLVTDKVVLQWANSAKQAAESTALFLVKLCEQNNVKFNPEAVPSDTWTGIITERQELQAKDAEIDELKLKEANLAARCLNVRDALAKYELSKLAVDREALDAAAAGCNQDDLLARFPDVITAHKMETARLRAEIALLKKVRNPNGTAAKILDQSERITVLEQAAEDVAEKAMRYYNQFSATEEATAGAEAHAREFEAAIVKWVNIRKPSCGKETHGYLCALPKGHAGDCDKRSHKQP